MTHLLKKNRGIKVALIGRVNVGKSTLFNRLIEESKAMVSPVAGTTRDIQYGICRWNKYSFTLTDTGGLFEFSKSQAEQAGVIYAGIEKQALKALKESSVVLFVADAQTGPMPEDKHIAKLVHRAKKPVLLLVNKADSARIRNATVEEAWMSLGLGKPHVLSAANGSGTGDALDALTETFRALGLEPGTDAEDTGLKIVLIGKPNVGKSSLVNAILGEERVIVSPLPHTTREPQDTAFRYKDRDFILVDTAGIRKKARVEAGLERMGVARSIHGLDTADIALLVTDVNDPLGSQDSHLAKLLVNYGVGVILVANKWDLIPEKDSHEIERFVEYYGKIFPHLSFAPIAFVSAKTKQRVTKLLDLALEVEAEREKVIAPKALERLLVSSIKKHPPTRGGGSITHLGKKTRHPFIYSIEQTGVKPPRFTIVISPQTNLNETYVKFIQKQLREEFNFEGTPLHLTVVKKKFAQP